MRNVMAVDKGKIIGIPSAASGVSYDNTESGLTSANVQDAINEVCDDLSDKVDKVAGKGLSTNDYDNTAKGIVDGVTSALAGKVSTSSVGSANGVAELDANGKVPSSQLPSYVDDVLEYADLAHFPATGETGKIYIAEDTNKTYRWSGSDYAEISESLALGETSSTAYAGNKGKANADAIAAIKDGTNLDSFGDVETALAGKASTNDLGDKSNLTTTDKSSCVGAINEVNGVINTLNSRVMTSGNSCLQSVNFPCRSGYCCVSVNAFVQQYGSIIFDVIVADRNIVTKDRITGTAVGSEVATFAYNYGVLTITFSNEATFTATFQTP